MRNFNHVKMFVLISVFGVTFLNLNVTAQSQSSELVARVHPQLGLTIEDCHKELIAVKKLPYSSEESIMVIPKIAKTGDHFFSLDSYILLVDSKTGKIKSQFYESHKTNGWTSDAIRLSDISIDTAPYLLNKTTRAFGIRVTFIGSSHANPYDSETISLFYPDGERLHRVLKNYTTHKYRGEWDTSCEGTFKTESKVLIMSETKTNGIYDIVMKNKIINTTNIINKNGECVAKDTAKTKRRVLRFQDKRYQ